MKKYIPFFAGAVFMCCITTALLWLCLKKNDGIFCYPLDDTFIHMAVAKNIALHGTWGVNPNEWVSASSSPLFSILLSTCFKLFGISIYTPFILAFMGTILVALILNIQLNKHTTLSILQKSFIVTVSLAFGVMPLLAIGGMEHSLQAAFTLLFTFYAADLFVHQNKKAFWITAFVGALMVATRYENVFVVAAACGIFFLNKQIKNSILLAALTVMPLAIFGIFFYLKGGYPIPNSVLIKGNNNINAILGGQVGLPAFTETLGGILVIAIILVYEKLKHQHYDRDFFILSIFIIATLLHGMFAQFGWYYRYESYLAVLGSFQLLKMLFQYFDWQLLRKPFYQVCAAVFFLFSINLVFRFLNGSKKTIPIVHNIYDQQYQMGKFVQQYYNNTSIAANDIGALCYFGNIKMFDMWGLASNEVTRARRKGYWNNEFLQKMVKEKNIELIIMYDSWFNRDLPKQWIKVAKWKMPNNIICGDDNITFYTTSENTAIILKNNLVEFQPQLPKDDTVEYLR